MNLLQTKKEEFLKTKAFSKIYKLKKTCQKVQQELLQDNDLLENFSNFYFNSVALTSKFKTNLKKTLSDYNLKDECYFSLYLNQKNFANLSTENQTKIINYLKKHNLEFINQENFKNPFDTEEIQKTEEHSTIFVSNVEELNKITFDLLELCGDEILPFIEDLKKNKSLYSSTSINTFLQNTQKIGFQLVSINAFFEDENNPKIPVKHEYILIHPLGFYLTCDDYKSRELHSLNSAKIEFLSEPNMFSSADDFKNVLYNKKSILSHRVNTNNAIKNLNFEYDTEYDISIKTSEELLTNMLKLYISSDVIDTISKDKHPETFFNIFNDIYNLDSKTFSSHKRTKKNVFLNTELISNYLNLPEKQNHILQEEMDYDIGDIQYISLLFSDVDSGNHQNTLNEFKYNIYKLIYDNFNDLTMKNFDVKLINKIKNATFPEFLEYVREEKNNDILLNFSMEEIATLIKTKNIKQISFNNLNNNEQYLDNSKNLIKSNLYRNSTNDIKLAKYFFAIETAEIEDLPYLLNENVFKQSDKGINIFHSIRGDEKFELIINYFLEHKPQLLKEFLIKPAINRTYFSPIKNFCSANKKNIEKIGFLFDLFDNKELLSLKAYEENRLFNSTTTKINPNIENELQNVTSTFQKISTFNQLEPSKISYYENLFENILKNISKEIRFSEEDLLIKMATLIGTKLFDKGFRTDSIKNLQSNFEQPFIIELANIFSILENAEKLEEKLPDSKQKNSKIKL